MDVKQLAFERTLKMLDNIGVKYAVIDFDGNKHGTLEVAAPKATRTKGNEPHGEITQYIRDHIKEMKPGDVVEVPMKYGRERTHSALCSLAFRLFGKKNSVTSYNEKLEVLQILRVY